MMSVKHGILPAGATGLISENSMHAGDLPCFQGAAIPLSFYGLPKDPKEVNMLVIDASKKADAACECNMQALAGMHRLAGNPIESVRLVSGCHLTERNNRKNPFYKRLPLTTECLDSVYQPELVANCVPNGVRLSELLDPSRGHLPPCSAERRSFVNALANHSGNGYFVNGSIVAKTMEAAVAYVKLHQEGYCDRSLTLDGLCFGASSCRDIAEYLREKGVKTAFFICATALPREGGCPAWSRTQSRRRR
jgi:hypothetical protein